VPPRTSPATSCWSAARSTWSSGGSASESGDGGTGGGTHGGAQGAESCVPPSPGGSSNLTSSDGCVWRGWCSAAHPAPTAPTASVSSGGTSWGPGPEGSPASRPPPRLPAHWSLPAQPAPAGPSSPAAATDDATATAPVAAPGCASAARATVVPSAPSAVTATTRRRRTGATWYVPVGRGPARRGGGLPAPGAGGFAPSPRLLSRAHRVLPGVWALHGARGLQLPSLQEGLGAARAPLHR